MIIENLVANEIRECLRPETGAKRSGKTIVMDTAAAKAKSESLLRMYASPFRARGAHLSFALHHMLATGPLFLFSISNCQPYDGVNLHGLREL